MSNEPLPIEELFRNNSRCRIIELFVEHSTSNDTYRTGDISDRVDKSQETVRKAINPTNNASLIELGIMEVVDPDATITHYKQAETPVVEYLQNINSASLRDASRDSASQKPDWEPIANCFNRQSTPKVTKFVLLYGDPDKEYGKTELIDNIGFSNRGFNNSIEQFIENGMIEKIEYDEFVYPKYKINLDCELADQIFTLNELLYETFIERQQLLEATQ